MEFSGQYLNYEEYTSLGGTLDIMPFNILEFESRKRIDSRTQNRLNNIEEIPQEVKMCMYAIMNTIESSIKDKRTSSVASESIDGYSITYLSPSEVAQSISTKETELEDIMFNYLLNVIVDNTPLLYLGVK